MVTVHRLAASVLLALALALGATAHAQPLPVDAGTDAAARSITVVDHLPHAAAQSDPVQDIAGISAAVESRQWPVALALGLSLLAFLLRRVAPPIHFFQTRAGVVLLSVAPAALTAASQALFAHGFAWVPIMVAVFTAALAQLEPSPSTTAAAASKQSGHVDLLMLLGILACGLGLIALASVTGCATGTDKGRQIATGIATVAAAGEHGLQAFQGPRELAIVAEVDAACGRQPLPIAGCVQHDSAARLAEFHGQRDEATLAFASVEAGLVVVERALDAVDARGDGRSFDPLPLVSPVLALVARLEALMDAMGILPAGLTAAVKGLGL